MLYYHNNHKEHTFIILPGWGFDARITNSWIFPEGNYLIVETMHCWSVIDKLDQFLQKKQILKQTCSIIAMSLGAFLFMNSHSSFRNSFYKIFCIGIAHYYPKLIIDTILKKIQYNKKDYLKIFYSNCFYPHPTPKYLLGGTNLALLKLGLFYLKTHKISINSIKNTKNLKLIHGKDDKISKPNQLKKWLIDPSINIHYADNFGHIPCKGYDFYTILYK